MKARTAADVRRLNDIPNIGPAMAKDFAQLGIDAPAQPFGVDASALHERLCAVTGVRHDPCVIDTLLRAVRFMEGAPALRWWHDTDERKRHLPSL